MRRPLRILAGAGLLAVALSVVPVTPVSAATREAMTIAPGQTVVKSYSGIPAPDPVTPVEADPTPEHCATLPSCALVPVNLAFPKGFDKDDDYFVRITLEWQTQEVKNPVFGESTTNDLDMYVWERPKKKNERGSEEPSRKSATGMQPEKTALDRPQGTVFDIVINNYAGSNNGFKLTLFWQVGESFSAFESLEPGREPSKGEESFSQPVDLSDVPESSFAGSEFGGADVGVGEGDPALLPIGEDSDLSGILGGGLSDVAMDDEDAANALAGSQREVDRGPLPEPSTIALVLSLVIAPAALAAAGAAWFVRRRPASLQVG